MQNIIDTGRCAQCDGTGKMPAHRKFWAPFALEEIFPYIWSFIERHPAELQRDEADEVAVQGIVDHLISRNLITSGMMIDLHSYDAVQESVDASLVFWLAGRKGKIQ